MSASRRLRTARHGSAEEVVENQLGLRRGSRHFGASAHAELPIGADDSEWHRPIGLPLIGARELSE